MADNDMNVVVYKLLAYLYACLKAGVCSNFSDIQSESGLLNIPKRYWVAVIEELREHGYITGVKITRTQTGPVLLNNGIRITLKGVEYLEENSWMQKTGTFLGESFQSVLDGLISGLASRA